MEIFQLVFKHTEKQKHVILYDVKTHTHIHAYNKHKKDIESEKEREERQDIAKFKFFDSHSVNC